MWPPAIAEQLRFRGHDVVAVAERGDLRTRSDEIVFEAARLERRVIVTTNIDDFRRLLAQSLVGPDRCPGLVFTPNRAFPRKDSRTLGKVVRLLDELLLLDPNLTDREHWLA